jgi:hypothetical protein
MRNPFRTPLATASIPRREVGHPNEGFAFPAAGVSESEFETSPEFDGSTYTPFPYHGTKGERFQESNPDYADTSNPTFLDNSGIVPSFAQLAPAPGSENLRVARNAGESAGTNRLYQSHGPVDGAAASQWSGENTALRTPVVGNSGPVSGGRDGANLAATAYFAAQAAQYSQAASDAAMVSAF